MTRSAVIGVAIAASLAVLSATACSEQVAPSARSSITLASALAASPAPALDAGVASDDSHVGAPTRAATSCPPTPWASYAHDPARTSASEGCVDGPLSVRWKLTRQGTCGYRFRAGRILHAIAEENAIFASVDCGESPAVMRVTPQGEPLWTFSRADYGLGTWPALAGDAILSTDDGVFLIDRETGKFRFHDLDVWGEPAVVGDSFYVDNTYQLDGYGPFLGAFGTSLKWQWQRSVINPGKNPRIPRTGGMAFADGRVVHAAAMGGHSVPSLSAHDASTGERRWTAPGTWPESAPSIAGGRVFAVERWHGEKADRLVARSLDDGAVAWSQAIAWARGPSPVIAGKLVIIHGAEGVRAHDRETGALVWSNPAPRKAAYAEAATTMAAALGSRTLVVASGSTIVVIKLEDGSEQWSGVVAGGVDRPVVVGRTVYVASDGALVRLDPH
jgi:outer membrane protein assembly factor BamB